MSDSRIVWDFEGHAIETRYDVVGTGPDLLLLSALSSIAMRAEMHPLASRLGERFRCIVPGWPGFDDAPALPVPLSPDLLRAFVAMVAEHLVRAPVVGVAAGHGAPYLVEAARRHPGLFTRLVLVAPTWRGPLPTMTGGERRSWFERLRKAIELPVLGPALYRLNLSRPVVARMMRAHVYADPAHVTQSLLDAKLAVRVRPSARFATGAFVTGALDPVVTREDFLALFEPPLPPVRLIRPRAVPPKSGAEMDALANTGRVDTVTVPGALAAHEEHPDAVAQAVLGPSGRNSS